MREYTFLLVLIVALLVTACGGGEAVPLEPTPEDAPPSAPPVVEEAPAEPVEEPTAVPEPTAIPEPDFDPQPPDGQRVEFSAEDGAVLVGYYYPASVPNAPIIVLMHWAGGDQTDWTKNGMIDWLQNRGGGSGMNSPSLQSMIYPPMPEGVSFALFTFDFRGFGESDGPFSQEKGLLDAKAAYEFAKTLEGVDPTRMAGVGSSIGADGAVNGCAEGCLGALSLSPGSYLTLPYTDEVKRLDDEEKPVTCVASEDDSTSMNTCEDAAGENYQSIIYSGDAHGDQFYQAPPEGFGQMLFDWLTTVFKIAP